ncbi:MAG: carboxypeptidase regulatory-like domain-containing protein, partial [Pseudomonadota bacterium]
TDTGTPTFSWDGITDPSPVYGVQVNNSNGDWLWANYFISGTSIVYNGPALTPGMTYGYVVSVQSSSACSDPTSGGGAYVAGNFTYDGAGGTITVSGIVKDWNGNVITSPGVTVTLVGDPTKMTISSTTDGSFSLPGVPVNTPFSLKFSKSGYLDVYTADITVAAADVNISVDAFGGSTPFQMPTAGDLTAFGAMPGAGKALITGRVSDQTYRSSSNVGGVVVTATGSSATYPVTYRDPFGVLSSTPSTWGNGRYYVLNVDGGDTVTLNASKTGWVFGPRTFHTQDNAVSQGRIWGNSPGYDASFSGFVKNSVGAAVSGATIALNGDPGKSTMTTGDGSYTFGSLPRDANFYAKVTAAGYVPMYAGPFNLQGPVSGINTTLRTASEMSVNFGVTGSNGLLTCKVFDPAMTPLSGATVTLSSKSGTSYSAFYSGGGQSTNETGDFAVPNILPGDVVKIEVTKAGYTFLPVYLDGFTSSVTGRYIVGAVQQTPFNVYSYHQDTSYFINMFVDDPSHAFTGVTVNGPGLSGDVSLDYTAARGRWEIAASIVLGTTLPTGERTYNFTAATGGTPVTASKTVSVYVEGLADNLLPTGNVTTAQPTFSWTGIAGATGYAVVLDDVTASTWVWSSPQLISTQISVLYDGPALTAGHTYQYTVISSINTDGNSNSSFADGQFTYTGPADTIAPSAPNGLTATGIGSSQIDLSWTASTDNVGVTGYKVYQDGIEVGTTASLSFSDTGLTASTNYCYTVKAYDLANNFSGDSNQACATTQSGTPQPLQGDINADGSVNLTDAILALQVLSGMNPSGVSLSGDVNADGRIGIPAFLHPIDKISLIDDIFLFGDLALFLQIFHEFPGLTIGVPVFILIGREDKNFHGNLSFDQL